MSETNGQQQTSEFAWDDLEPQEFQFTIKKEPYVIKEGSAGAIIKWRGAILKQARMGANGRVTNLEAMASVDVELLALCLFKVKPDGAQVPVDMHTIKMWPGSLVDKLTDKCKQLNNIATNTDDSVEGLRKQIAELQEKLDNKLAEQGGEDDPAKNSPSATVEPSA